MYARRENDMEGCKEDPVALATLADIKTPGAFAVRSSFSSDLQTECRSKWAAYVGGWVCGGHS